MGDPAFTYSSRLKTSPRAAKSLLKQHLKRAIANHKHIRNNSKMTNSMELHTLHVFNPLSPKIHIQILQTDLHTFLLRIVGRIWFKIKAFATLVINLIIFITFTLDDLLTLL